MSGIYDKAKKLASKYSTYHKPEFYPTGSVIWDLILGGGLPRGTFIEIASESGLGKSTSVLHFAKVLCKLGKKVAYLDFEKGVNQSQIDGIGLTEYVFDPESNPDGIFFIFQVTTFEEGEEILDELLAEGDISLVIIDSATAILPGKFMENIHDPKKKTSVTSVEPGLQARIMSVFLQKYKAFAARYKTTFVFINQMRTKINFRGSYQDTAGGNALRFYMDIRIMLEKEKELVKSTDTIEGRKQVQYGADVKIWAKKNRYAPPFVEGVFTVFFGKGISNISSYIRWMKNNKVVNPQTGKEVDMIKQGHGGYYTITLPQTGEIKARGEAGILKVVKEYTKEIKDYINNNGGFQLIQREEEDDE